MGLSIGYSNLLQSIIASPNNKISYAIIGASLLRIKRRI